MADGSIFAPVIGSMTSFGDALSGLLGNTTAKQSDAGSSAVNQYYQEARSLQLENRLQMNRTNSPYGPQSFQAGKGQMAPSVDMEGIQNQWLQRLNRYSNMPVYEGGKAKGA